MTATTKRRLRYWRTYSAQDSVRRAGPSPAVAEAWGESPGGVRHKASTREDPAFSAALDRCEQLALAGCSPRPFALHVLATENRVRIVEADRDDLIEHGCNLLDSECAWDGNEDRAEHKTTALWLEALDSGLPLLSEIRDVARYLLDVHGVDLLAEWRAR